ncbi:tetratricopeptide repeat protein [uncultured Roseovarius sp.]|uniref:tetratricopeptide repeat protein n=1 Tax=uncultured Roseovarius sp. TaxID=293344 RepID=UPI00260D2C56|nr:tetratricopeptide repeat protein [uncultured Roseovarius sp.]
MLEYWIAVKEWLVAEAAWVVPLTAIITALAVLIGWVKWPFKRDRPTQLAPETIDQIKPSQARDGPALTVSEFIRLRRELKADLEQELAEAAEGEKTQLRARIAELESQIANPEKSLAEARKRIADLEALLDREANHIGGDRIAEAKAALEQGDYSLADAIFAEIEARNELAISETARAAYGRGEVAEAEVRWHDAARHYADAARLNPGYDALFKARAYAWRAGHLDAAHRYGADLVALARTDGKPEKTAAALNDHALTINAQGQYAEAEGLYREALQIGRATIGEGHPDYATNLNNLALVLEAQGRYAEAEGLYRQSSEIERATIGEGHPNYAIGLNNLALVVQAQGRYAEAEGLYREALEIDRATIGEMHPEYANRMGNLALVVQAQGRYTEAEGLYRQSSEIERATIGEEHPDYAVGLKNLAGVLVKLNRATEARPLLEQALAIFRATLPADHPHIAGVQSQLAVLPDD